MLDGSPARVAELVRALEATLAGGPAVFPATADRPVPAAPDGTVVIAS